MAVVKSEKTIFEGANFVVRIRFSARSGLFSITLPEAVNQGMGVKEITSDTLNGVQAEYKKTLKEYRNSKTTERKVIVYQVEGNAWVYRRSDDSPGRVHSDDDADDDATVLFQANDISFGDGCGLMIYAEVMIERTRKSQDESYVSYKEVEDTTIPRSLSKSDGRTADEFGTTDGIQVIDWTPEREKWFSDIGCRLEDMVMNVYQTLKDEKTALQLMDSGRMLMAPAEEKPARSSGRRRKKA